MYYVDMAKKITALSSNFSADTVLYDRVLPNFSLTDNLSILGGTGSNTATVSNRRFSGKVGIKTDTIIAYNHGTFTDPVFNRVSNISADGQQLTLVAVGQSITGVNNGGILAAGISTNSTFRIKVPRITNIRDTGLFTKLPKTNISQINTSNSNLIISRQLTNQGITNDGNGLGSITLTSQAGIAATTGITSAFFEPFDAEKYSIHYTDGSTEPLTSDQVTITNSGNDIVFSGLSKNSGNVLIQSNGGFRLVKIDTTHK